MSKENRKPKTENGLNFAFLLPLLILCHLTLPMWAQDATPFTRLFDTGKSNLIPLTEIAVAKRTGWQLIPEDKTNHAFTGDAALLNDKLAVVLRLKTGQGPEVYYKTDNGWKHRAGIGRVEMLSGPVAGLSQLKILENNGSAVMIEATFGGSGPAAMQFRLTTGEAILEIRPEERAGFVAVQSKIRSVVVPDYFGDDMIFGIYSPPTMRSNLCLPAENFCLSLLEGGDAIIMNVWQSREQEVWLNPGNQSGAVSMIGCLKGKSIWLAFLEFPGIWRTGNVADKPPFAAKWRCSFLRENGLADSWDRERGPTPLQTEGSHQGPLIIYPIDRSDATPLTVLCPTDVMRNTLGVGPCQYILSVEGLAAEGDPTPDNVMNWVEKQFAQKKENKTADDIKERLEQMTAHVGHARARIERYAGFAGQARKLVTGKPGSDLFLLIIGDLDRFVKAGLDSAATPEQARNLTGEVTALIGKANAPAACQRLGEQLRALGAVQERALAKCRMSVRRLKQAGRTITVNQPQDTTLAQEVQRLAEQMLQNK